MNCNPLAGGGKRVEFKRKDHQFLIILYQKLTVGRGRELGGTAHNALHKPRYQKKKMKEKKKKKKNDSGG